MKNKFCAKFKEENNILTLIIQSTHVLCVWRIHVAISRDIENEKEYTECKATVWFLNPKGNRI